MAYKPTNNNITDDDLKLVTGEAVFEALKNKVAKPSVNGSNGQVLSLSNSTTGETAWVNSGGSVTSGNLTETTSSVLTITGGTDAVLGSGTTIQVKQSSTSQSGFLSSTDWNTFNNKEPSVTKGNLTESTSSVLTINGGSNAVIGSGTSIQVKEASESQSGYISSTDWSRFQSLLLLKIYGSGKDGNATINSASQTISGVMTSGSLIRDVYFNDLTITGSGKINTNGFRIYVRGTLDISGASGAAIICNAPNGNNSTGTAGGSGGTAGSSKTSANGNSGASGGSGVIGAGGVGSSGSINTYYMGGTANTNSTNGKGGISGATAGGNGGTTGLSTYLPPYGILDQFWSNGLIGGGGSGGGGGAGAGDGVNPGGGGGGGGCSGGVVQLAAYVINRSSSNTVGTIAANGGNGGNGRTQTTGNVGGGGGGQGGAGGCVHLTYNSLTGSSATNLITANGGTGGTGGNGVGTGIGGNGGAGGGAGTIIILNTALGTITTSANGTAVNGTTTATITGGTGGTGGTSQVTL